MEVEKKAQEDMKATFDEKENEQEAKMTEMKEQHAACLQRLKEKEAEVAEAHAAKVTECEAQILDLTRRVSRHEQVKRELEDSKKQAEAYAH